MAMSRIRTVDFLPEIFRTETNKQFLNATLDQLTQNPKLKPTQGYIGRRIGPGVNPNDSYVLEPTKSRADYQLEPGVVFLKENTNTVVDAITYPGLIDSVAVQGGNTTRYDRLWSSEYYAFDPFVDYDKFVNFSQYFWLPEGPDSVTVSPTNVPSTYDFNITRTDQGYTINGYPGINPTITIVRNGSYTFNVNQTGKKFYIQSSPGVNGMVPATPNMSSRDVLGVTNNGADLGTVSFAVPSKDAQQFYYNLENFSIPVDFVSELSFSQINNQPVDEFIRTYGGIDGISDIENRTLILVNSGKDSGFDPLEKSVANNGLPGSFDTTPYDQPVSIRPGWQRTTLFDPLNENVANNGYTGSFDTLLFDQTTEISPADYHQLWQITFTNSDGINYINLVKASDIPNLQKFYIRYGDVYNNTGWYKNDLGELARIPLLSAPEDLLFYQDGSDPTFFGAIKVIDSVSSQVINVDTEILGAKNYISPNNVEFTNGLKIQFQGNVFPESYIGNEYYVEGVGESIKLLSVHDFVTPETYTQSSSIPYDSMLYDVGGYDSTTNAPMRRDYLTINRASLTQNAWSRSNRWFHIDVIYATAAYNNTSPMIDNAYRAQRPIIEFRPNIKLFNFGTSAIAPVNIIDFEETDALSDINGQPSYAVDGYAFISGTRVIFAADIDLEVRNKVYEVNFVDPTGLGDFVIDLQPVDLRSPDLLVNQNVVCLNGATRQGKSYWFNGIAWIEGQQKTSINQPPLFDVFDQNGYSFADTEVYPSSTFKGTKLFSYAVGNGNEDPILGQPLKYLTINNVGDIVFENNLYTDSFVYVENTVGITESIEVGSVREYSNRVAYNTLLGWQTGFTETVSRQMFTFTYSGQPLTIDIPVTTNLDAIPVKVFVNANFLVPSGYTYAINSNGSTTILFNQWVLDQEIVVDGAAIEVSVISDIASNVGFYSVPLNLENNPINDNTTEITLGTIRNHYGTICQNLRKFNGDINGRNNTRDLGNIVPYGQIILQQSAPTSFAGTFLRTGQYEFSRAIEFNGAAYQKFKNLLLDTVTKINVDNKTPATILDEVLEYINVGKTQMSPFYWSDMIPSGDTYDETSYEVTTLSTNIFDLLYSYDFSSSNFSGFLVYLNNRILIGDNHEYSYVNGTRKVNILVDLKIGDTITIREYQNTTGSFVPNTPTKLRMYPAYEPIIFVDDTYINPTTVIQGHDGSITVAFNDVRDEVLLEFERRVYSNLKGEHQERTLNYADVAPGQFRKTDYTQAEITQILNLSFLSWVGSNKLDYRVQDWLPPLPDGAPNPENSWNWNYSNSTSKISNETLLGNWRGIYNYFYDTNYPHTRPWEMLGFSEKPRWWESEYGPAPYTSGNLVLWSDLEAGLVKDPAGHYVDPKYIRPGLTNVIPVDSQGNLLPPIASVVNDYDTNSFRKSWIAGDEGPVEASWRRSSEWPFAVMKLLSITKPAKFFALNLDLDFYKYNADYNQYLYNNRFRVNPTNVQIYGDGVSKSSYINWIIDYNRVSGLDSTKDLTTLLNNIDVRLCYRMAGFSDKQYLKIYTEKSSPDSTNTSLLLPDESFQLSLYKNPTFDTIIWSSVVVQRTEYGYSVYGYSTNRPYFEILESVPSSDYRVIRVGDQSVRVNSSYSNNVVQVPYGYEFVSISGVVDFLISYGKLLEQKGMIFNDVENTKVLNWDQMAQEFLYWTQQGWGPGSLINLNPSANVLEITRPGAVVESLNAVTIDDIILNQNKKPIPNQDYVVSRQDNTIRLTGVNNQTFNYLYVKFTAYENIIVFDNNSIFNDLIYKPITGARQSRLMFVGQTTYEWNGQLDAQGFILNQDNIVEWKPNISYTKGQIVLYKGSYWSAATALAPAEVFEFSDWIKSDYNQISKGLLPNIATKDELIRNFYNLSTANLERDADLLSYGLIGFRPREYMQALNLGDITQVNLYQQFLGTKGTKLATDIFTRANLNKEVAEYEIFENWAIQRASYGATSSRAYFEIQLNQALLQSNPSTIEIISPGQTSIADQTVLYSNLWNESYKITNANILPTTILTNDDRSLPSAGYVNYNDVSVKSFDWESLSQSIADYTAEVGEERLIVGTPIWVAKINSYDWGVYRTNLANGSVISVKDNLNGTTTIVFDAQHGLKSGQKIIIKQFSNDFDGVFDVLTVPSLYTITVNTSLTGNSVEITGDGRCFYLGSMRVATPNQVASLPYVNKLYPGAQAWVDNIGNGTWAVYKKIQAFTSVRGITNSANQDNEKFGWSVTQGFTVPGALVGAPGYNNNKGAVYGFVQDAQGNYFENALLTADTTIGVENYGWAVDAGRENWAVVGAPGSIATVGATGYAAVIRRGSTDGNYRQSQLLVPPYTTNTEEFGYSVAISPNEYWIYVGSPSNDKVFAYSRVDVQNQVKDFVGDGTTVVYPISDVIKVDKQNLSLGLAQIIVTINGIPKVANGGEQLGDYGYDGNNVIFNEAPPLGSDIRILRRQAQTFTINEWSIASTWNKGQYVIYNNNIYVAIKNVPQFTLLTDTEYWSSTQNQFDLSNLYTAITTESITVYNNGTILRPGSDYILERDMISGIATLTLTGTVVIGSLVISSETYFAFVDEFTVDGALGTRFGHSVTAGNDGSDLLVGAPDKVVNGYLAAGAAYYVKRSVRKFKVTGSGGVSFTFDFIIPAPVNVSLYGTFLVPNTIYNNNGQFTVGYSNNSTIVTLQPGVVSVGDVIEISSNDFYLIQEITSNNANTKQNFGAVVDVCPTNCTEYIAAPGDSSTLTEAGSVDRWINQVRLFGVVTNNNQDPTLTPGDILYINGYPVTASAPAAWNNSVEWKYNTLVASGTDVYQSVQHVPVGIELTNTNYWKKSTWVESYARDIISAKVPNVTASSADGYLTIYIVNDAAAAEFNKLEVLPGPGTNTLFDDLGITTFIWSQTIRSPNEVAYAHFGTSINAGRNNLTLVVGAPDGEARQPVIFDSGTTTFDYNTTEFYSTVGQGGVAYTFDYIGANPVGSAADVTKFVFGQQLYDPTATTLENFGQSVSYVGTNLLVGASGSALKNGTKNGTALQFKNPTTTPAWVPIYAQKPVVDVYLLNSIYTYDRLTSNVTEYFDFVDPLQGKILGAARQNIDFIGVQDPAMYNTGNVNNQGITWGEEHIGEIWWDLSTVRFVDYHQDDLEYSSRRWGQLFPGSSVDVYQWIESTVLPADYVTEGGVGTPYSTTSYTVNTKLNQNTGIFETRYFFWVKDIPEVATFAKKTLSTTAIKQYIENPKSAGIPYAAAISSGAIALYNSGPYVSAQDTILTVNFDRIKNSDNIHTEYDLIANGDPDSFVQGSLYRKLLDSFCGEDEFGNLVPDPGLKPASRYGVKYRPRQSMFVDRFAALKNYLSRANSILAQYPIVDMRSFSLLDSSEKEPSQTSGLWNKKLATYEELSYQDLWEVPVGYSYLVVSDSTVNGLWTIYTVQETIPGVTRDLYLSRVQTYDTKQYWTYINWVKEGYNNNVKPALKVSTYTELQKITPVVGLTAQVSKNGTGKYEIYEYQNTGTTSTPVYEWVRVVLEDGTIEINSSLWNYASGAFGFDVEVFDAQRFDEAPVAETRQILKALNEEIFINDLAIYRNQLLILAFKHILTEQLSPDWLFKTSLIDVNHKIRNLLPYQIYQQDNQDFVLDYIKEVKPYHVQIREFNLRYDGSDTYKGTVTDFDVPAYYDNFNDQYVSPILDNSEFPADPASARPSTWAGWQQLPYNQWFQNYTLSVDSVTVINPGTGYFVPPTVTVVPNPLDPNIDNIVAPVLSARLFTNGSIRAIDVLAPGSGYTLTPTINIKNQSVSKAWAIPVMVNNVVRSFATTIKFDRYDYTSEVVNWTENSDYVVGDLIRFNNTVYTVNENINSGTEFDPENYSEVSAENLSATNRVMGYYNPTVNQPGIDLALLINGIDYPGVQVYGVDFILNPGFDTGADRKINWNVSQSQDPLYLEGYRDVPFSPHYIYDSATDTSTVITYPGTTPPEDWVADRFTGGAGFDSIPFDNISFLPDGSPTYDVSILDAVYESEFTDPYLGTLPAPAYNGAPPDNLGPNPIVISGGEFIDTYSSHAPEELIPGAIFDTLDLRVYTRPGSLWDDIGHGFSMLGRSFVYHSTSANKFFFGIDSDLGQISAVRVINLTTGASLTESVDYTINWPELTLEMITNSVNLVDNNSIEVNTYGIGGGSQIYKQSYIGSDVGNNLVISVNYQEIYTTVVIVNGEQISNYNVLPYNNYNTMFVFDNTYTESDRVFIAVFGRTTPVQYEYSYPITQYITYNGTSSYSLSNSMLYTNSVDAVVERNGLRLRPAECAVYYGDGATINFELPTTSGETQEYINDSEVIVYINNAPQDQGLNYTISPWTGSNNRYVEFNVPPAPLDRVYIAVTSNADYTINPISNILTLKVGAILDSSIAVTTWNDSRQQELLTQVFVGPVKKGVNFAEGYSTTVYDPLANNSEFNNEPGSFDYTFGDVIYSNDFDIGRVISNPQRLWVTKNGKRLSYGEGYTVSDNIVTLTGPVIGNGDVIVITSFTQSSVPAEMSFRIFQDMRGAQILYRMTPNSTTELVADLTAESDIIFVKDVKHLSEPNLELGLFGSLTINGERLTYRNRDLANNTVSGLRRGVAGTAASSHTVGSAIYDITRGQALPVQYQKQVRSNKFLGNGINAEFATDIYVSSDSSIVPENAVRVLVGGTELQSDQFNVDAQNPVIVTLSAVPAAGTEVVVFIEQAQVMYEQGIDTASNGVALQEQSTMAAKFIRSNQ